METDIILANISPKEDLHPVETCYAYIYKQAQKIYNDAKYKKKTQ
jgi:hypothetical protein